ncbi:putative metal-binding motif-containing protein [Myxococcus sp. K38C18041901]|uniref:putative metal-binding motif-containing protein n=1 Tax=Myxococcus guangdongensis TaxID=2906760 RepID=UPI0020A7D2D3|nr:putative metal-binding motif-containing protein [Myxococcus guangdongensis]MCP3062689.1 putative metal-binding motif-containing protein [Myxococcus guangdongensis]
MTARYWRVVLVLLWVVTGCDSSEGKGDAGTVVEDGGAREDGGTPEDAGPGDAGTDPLACEKQHGVCAGARRAMVDGAYEPECTALSYGADYESAETRCDGLDNDCDGVTDPSFASRVTNLDMPYVDGLSILRTDQGVFVSMSGNGVRILRLNTDLVLQGTGTVSMPWTRKDAPVGVSYAAKLLRTQDGLALVYATHGPSLGPPFHAYLVPLDAQGLPKTGPEGDLLEFPLVDWQGDGRAPRMATSPQGDRVVVVWRTGTEQTPPFQVMGAVTDLRGQVLVAPKVLFTSPERKQPWPSDVLVLRNEEVLVAVNDESPALGGDTVRLRRFNTHLDPVGDERSFELAYGAAPRLVELGATRGGPLESPVLLMRSRVGPPWVTQVQVVQNLFSGGVGETWSEVPTPQVAWYGALADEGVLRLAWLSKHKDYGAPPPGGDSFLGWEGRLWTQDEGHASADRSPTPDLLPLHAHAQWVLMEKLAPRQVGALYMTSTVEGSSLDAVRYCTP